MEDSWSNAEEAAFAQLMQLGLTRIAAIQLFKRCGRNLVKALKVARGKTN